MPIEAPLPYHFLVTAQAPDDGLSWSLCLAPASMPVSLWSSRPCATTETERRREQNGFDAVILREVFEKIGFSAEFAEGFGDSIQSIQFGLGLKTLRVLRHGLCWMEQIETRLHNHGDNTERNQQRGVYPKHSTTKNKTEAGRSGNERGRETTNERRSQRFHVLEVGCSWRGGCGSRQSSVPWQRRSTLCAVIFVSLPPQKDTGLVNVQPSRILP